uniref:RWD domain-containing protein n=1 Tax=Magallana gigas TaxID=29159 RepID=K1Q959_MAGGI
MANEDQIEELEALRSIFENEFTDISKDPPCFMIKLQDVQINAQQWINENVSTNTSEQPCDNKELEKEEKNDSELTPVRFEEPKLTGGRW